MTDYIQQFFSNIFNDNVVLCTILIAMVPIIELKGAIPFSMSVSIWGEKYLSLWQAFLFGLIGSSLIIPFLALIYKPVINFLKKRKIFKNLAEKIENKISKKKNNIEEKISQNNYEQTRKSFDVKNKHSEKLVKMFFVFLFVAIPLPFTGVWTGSCLAVAMGLNFFESCLVVFIGNITAGLIITFVSSLFGTASLILVYILFAIILLYLIFKLIFDFYKKRKMNVDKS